MGGVIQVRFSFCEKWFLKAGYAKACNATECLLWLPKLNRLSTSVPKIPCSSNKLSIVGTWISWKPRRIVARSGSESLFKVMKGHRVSFSHFWVSSSLLIVRFSRDGIVSCSCSPLHLSSHGTKSSCCSSCCIRYELGATCWLVGWCWSSLFFTDCALSQVLF